MNVILMTVFDSIGVYDERRIYVQSGESVV